MAALTPLADTQRTLDWDELPASVREIPAGFDPGADGVLMAHQSSWIAFRATLNIAVSVKGRRTGITFAEALDDTIIAASVKEAGGDNVWYVPDTKDKGLEFIGYCAKFARVIAHGQAVSGIEQYLFDDRDPVTGETKHITAWRIRFASGYRITALASRPENLRGLQGIVVIDEAAFHGNVAAVLEAAVALLIWGGRIRIISTHNGKKNPFNQLVKDIEKRLYGKKAGVHRITFDDAVANGLYERVCYMQGKQPTPEGKQEWYTSIRAAYGPRTAAMREELDAIPRDGAGIAIPGVWIEAAMPEPRPVLRVALPDDFAARPEADRRKWADAWIARHLQPLLDQTDKLRRHALGMDFARHRDFSVIIPAVVTPLLNREVPWVIELSKVPTRQQEQILWAILDHWKKIRARWTAALDATGPGLILAEYTADRYGRPSRSARPMLDRRPNRVDYAGGHVHEVMLTPKWYAEHMPAWVDSFEDGTASYPRDEALEQDFRAVEEINGVPRVPEIRRKDLKDPDLYRHGDAAIAAALMWYASRQALGAIDWQAAPDKHERWDGKDDSRQWHDTPPRRETPGVGKGGAW